MSEKRAKGTSKQQKLASYIIENNAPQSVVIIHDDLKVEHKVNLDKCLRELAIGVQPINYEQEIIAKKNEIKRDPLKKLLVFPEDDVLLHRREQELRTEYSTVPPQAFKDATDLFVRECLHVYTSDHWELKYNYADYGDTYFNLKGYNEMNAARESLRKEVFEIDIQLDETDNVQESILAPMKENGIYKEGYLTKSPFHSDGAPAYGSKTYKRRWFTLKQTSSDGSYILEYRKEEGSAMAKGTLYLDSCTQIRKGIKGRMNGFQLHIQDKIYGLAADSLTEMETWVRQLCRATGIEIEQEKSSRSFFGGSGGGKSSTKNYKNFRDSLRNSSHPLLQEYAKETDQGNWKARQEYRLNLFAIYPDLNNSYGVTENKNQLLLEPFRAIPTGIRFLVRCQELQFKLTQENGANYEPFFFTLALYDARSNTKLSEDFSCSLNDSAFKEMMSAESSESTTGGDGQSKQIHSPRDCVFSVESPHAEIYLVVRINKMLQGGIGQCTEPYIKQFDNPKAAHKLAKQFRATCRRLGEFRMPFGWAARQVFKNEEGEIEDLAPFTHIFKQETGKLSDEELLKSLKDKGELRNKQTIPGSFSCDISLLPPNHPNCYSPSLIPLKPFSCSKDVAISLQVQTFCQKKIETMSPFNEYLANFYVYPLSLNYSSQKSVKARNIVCTVEFKDSDESSAKPLKCIYKRDGTCSFTHKLTCPVLYHNTSPTFYEEIKILLPPQVTKKHHVLFTFQHVSVEQPKESKEKKKDVTTPAGYCWMPVLSNNIVRPDESQLSVSVNLPDGYLNLNESTDTTPSSPLASPTNAPATSSKHPEVRWADGKGQNIFKVNSKLVSTISTQDECINTFFAHWQNSDAGKPSDVETSRLLKLLHGIDSVVVVKFLPVLLNTFFQVLVQGNNQDVAVNVVSLLIRIVSLIYKENKAKYLHTYVKYVFEIDTTKTKTVHEELSKHLIFYLRLGADPEMIANILQHSWFFFEIMLKSMAQTDMRNDVRCERQQQSRENRFSLEFHRSLENLVQVYIYQLTSRVKDKPNVVREANRNLAAFIKAGFSHMDRGYVFTMVNYLKDQFTTPDQQMFELKFDFIRALCEHEHYLPLNLPLDIRARGDVHESTLNDQFCSRHFLAGILLKEVSVALYQGTIVRKYAIRVLRNILAKHEFDERYQSEEMQSRIASLYIPYLTTMLEHSARFHKYTADDTLPEKSTNSKHTSRVSGRMSVLSSPVSSASDHTSTNIQSFDENEAKELLLCFLYVLKNLKSIIVVDWWRDILRTTIKRPLPPLHYMQQEKHFAKFMGVIDFFELLECCLKIFGYTGKKAMSDRSNSEIAKQFLENKYSSLSKPSPSRVHSMIRESVKDHRRTPSAASTISQSISSNLDLTVRRSKLEASLSTEVAIIVLDMLELFCTHFKFHLEQDEGDNVLMKKIFNVMMTFLRVAQSENITRHVFAVLRSFIHKFPTSLYKGSSKLCGILCYEILCLCNSKIASVRTQACCFMYLLMRSNFEYSGKGCVRVHHQVIIAVSKLIASGMNRASMSQSLVTLKNYASEDKGMKNAEFQAEVRDLIKKVHTVLQATSQMKEHEDDHEVLVDLEYSLAKSYSSTPELRQTWLHSMASIHVQNKDYSEAAMCYIHSAALVAEYLKSKGTFLGGCAEFKAISTNLLPDENRVADEEGEEATYAPVSGCYLLKDLIELLEKSVDHLQLSERYEIIGDVYKIAVPLYEEERNYECLAMAYGTLKEAYEKILQVIVTGKRVLGRYYRVAFFGRVFNDSDGKEYVYKEPKLTSLSEISLRLSEKYNEKYGNVKLIQDSSKVKPEELNSAVNYIQVSFVTPYFDEEEYEKRVTTFERENNLRRFVFETPFTLSGKAHGALAEQHKRKTILTTSHSFPYVKKRILVVQQEVYELSPIEVAIDEMRGKVKELNQVISLDPPDMKKLQLKLGGSVSVQVNAGPLAYAQTFLDASVVRKYVSKHVEALQATYRDFVGACGRALELNAMLIKPDQAAYQEDLEERYQTLKENVAVYAGENEPRGSLPIINSPKHSEA